MTTATNADFETLAGNARKNTVPSGRISVFGPNAKRSSDEPSIELYHFGFSICSYKVRAVIHELGLTWRSLELEPAKFENYKAEYVRLRLESDVAKSSSLATGWDGGSSVKESGFDALVVPTLVDLRQNTVIVDSLQICLYLARAMGGNADLLPSDIEGEVLAELDTVDRTPHVALLYGPNPYRDGRSIIFRKVFKSEHEKKAAAVLREAEKVKGQDPRLDAAYEAKIAKEKAGTAFVGSPEKMAAAIKETEHLIETFAKTLESSNGPWIFGDRYTMADVFWGASFFRLEFLGYSWLYRSDPRRDAVADYADRAIARPGVSAMVANWPTHPWSHPAAQWMRKPSLGDRLIGLGSREGARGDL
ncbi:MAG: glutathione S-transferase family protein [Pseudomonadota bacterium]